MALPRVTDPYPTEVDLIARKFSAAIEECLRVRDYQHAEAIDRERREYMRAIEQSGYGYNSFPNLTTPPLKFPGLTREPPPPPPKPPTTEEQIAAQKPYGAREIIFD